MVKEDEQVSLEIAFICLMSREDIKKKVMSIAYASESSAWKDPGQVEGNPVFIYLDAFCKDEYFAEFLPDYANLMN